MNSKKVNSKAANKKPLKNNKAKASDRQGHYDIDGVSLDEEAGITIASAAKPAAPSKPSNDSASDNTTPS